VIIEGQEVSPGLAGDDLGEASVDEHPCEIRPSVIGEAEHPCADDRDDPTGRDRQGAARLSGQVRNHVVHAPDEVVVAFRIGSCASCPPPEGVVERGLKGPPVSGVRHGFEAESRSVRGEHTHVVIFVEPVVGDELRGVEAQCGDRLLSRVPLAPQCSGDDPGRTQVRLGEPLTGKPCLQMAELGELIVVGRPEGCLTVTHQVKNAHAPSQLRFEGDRG
jgi:hypothetical protein